MSAMPPIATSDDDAEMTRSAISDLSRRSKKVRYSITSSAEMRREPAKPLD